ncbi:MAG: hypothetical protein R3297_01520 [Desulfobulbales bacterium]|nr:hypothetical protein [Desulfobulbales bacterium]
MFVLHLQTSKKELTVAEELAVVLETAVPENVEVKFPEFSASLGDFTLKESLIATPRLTGSGDTIRVVHRVRYIVEPYLSGTYSIPALTVSYLEAKKGRTITEITTEEIQVPVLSLMGGDAGPVGIKDIRPPLSLPPDRILQFMVVGLVIILAALAAAGFLYWKKTAAASEPADSALRPEEIALQELTLLLKEDLLNKGEIKSFHLRISNILRRYIENRFALQAPERTTEEFLTELSLAESAENTLLGSHKSLLTDFLTQCDLVKFAKHEPTKAESEKTIIICREFIEKTKE